mgnify:CR=1 FL=1
MSEIKKKPFLPKILSSLEPEDAGLLASQCNDCGKVGFPQRPFCTFCHSRDLKQLKLGTRGKIHTYTICHMPVPNLGAPYAIGYVDLPEKVRVFALFTEWEENGLEIGKEVEMELATLYEEGGEEVIAYKFRPVK